MALHEQRTRFWRKKHLTSLLCNFAISGKTQGMTETSKHRNKQVSSGTIPHSSQFTYKYILKPIEVFDIICYIYLTGETKMHISFSDMFSYRSEIAER